MSLLDLFIVVGRVVFSFALVLGLLPVLIWLERKGAAVIQDRPGPNRASILGIRAAGLVHTVGDVVKLVMKEDITPGQVDRRWWQVAPLVGMTVALVVATVIPWSDPLRLGGRVIPMVGADVELGGLLILALTSLTVYGTMLAGWSSNNKYSMLGGLRASAQMLSYELALGLAVVAVFLSAGTLGIPAIVARQAGPVWNWGILEAGGLVGIPVFLLFFTAVFAETNRVPFDLPEGDAELVGGFHTEYSSLRFALFFMGEYAAMIGASALTASLFFGGYNVPFLTGETLRAHAGTVLAVLGLGGAILFTLFVFLARRRTRTRFHRALPAGDPRRREPAFWAGVWSALAVASAALGGAGLLGLPHRVPAGPELVTFVVHLGSLGAKTLFGCWCFVWVRWTLPRFRYDQLMGLGWRRLLPWALGTVVLSGAWVVIRDGGMAPW